MMKFKIKTLNFKHEFKTQVYKYIYLKKKRKKKREAKNFNTWLRVVIINTISVQSMSCVNLVMLDTIIRYRYDIKKIIKIR